MVNGAANTVPKSGAKADRRFSISFHVQGQTADKWIIQAPDEKVGAKALKQLAVTNSFFNVARPFN